MAAEEEAESEPEAEAGELEDEAAEPEAEAGEPEDEPGAPAAEAGAAGAAEAAEAQGDALTAEDLPIADYDELTVSEILPLLAELDDDELADVRDYEDDNLGRVAIIARIDSMYEADAEPATEEEPVAEAEEEEPEAGGEEPEAEPEPEEEEPEPEPDEEPEAEAAAPAADDEAFDADEAYDDESDEFEDEEDEEDAAPAGAEDFPIADYDELRVAEILPLLSQLQADELEVVAAHEEQLANRSTILNRIHRLLDLGDKNPS